MNKTEDDERRFQAACLQFCVERGSVEANLAKVEAAATTAARQGCRLLVLPEMWTSSFVADPDPDLAQRSRLAEQELLRISGDLNVTVVGSALELEVQDGDHRYYNTARVFERGRELGRYRKIHLFSLNSEHRFHSAGHRPLVLDTAVGRMGVLICYDLRFPELVRYQFYKGAELLVVPAQWPNARSAHWRTLVRARAIENECFVLGCNRTGQETSLKSEEPLSFPGDSRIVDPMGDVLAAGAGEEAPVTAEIDLHKVRTMRRLMPVGKDQRPDVYRELWLDAWDDIRAACRDPEGNRG